MMIPYMSLNSLLNDFKYNKNEEEMQCMFFFCFFTPKRKVGEIEKAQSRRTREGWCTASEEMEEGEHHQDEDGESENQDDLQGPDSERERKESEPSQIVSVREGPHGNDLAAYKKQLLTKVDILLEVVRLCLDFLK